jgi:acyl-CoA thioester hydrolase
LRSWQKPVFRHLPRAMPGPAGRAGIPPCVSFIVGDMTESSAPEAAELRPLSSYPFQITLTSRFSDLAPAGAIEHIGMARNYEDSRGAFMDHLAEKAGIPRARLHSFIVRAVNERWAPVRYPGEITFGTAVIALGGSSFTIELAAFQAGACVGRSRALAVAIGEDHAPAPLTDEVRATWMLGFSERPGWRAPAKPAPERRLPGHYPHHLSLRPRFSDTDLLGHLNNVSLLRYADEGRAALLLTGGEAGVFSPGSLGTVARVDISYLQEAKLPHPLMVASRIRAVQGGEVLLEQALFQGDVCVVVCDTTVSVPAVTAGRLAAQLSAA